ncbi:glutathione transferase GST 23-like isoform X2 [Magnolia sinica]|uniref:glutathione transferase GST 23-like isoform X2 n=1 Tax=Magnolia sinica TaxID=86752 RepID=UPI002659B8DA|nr:glutathione transferase GST 23-like isoform X2 [Magnolia sinica]
MEMGGEVKVFGAFPSPLCYRIEWALKHKGITYEYVHENLRDKSPLLLKYNPVYKKVPVLLHDGNPVTESLVILEYIDETWKENPILPEDPYQRAMARFWAKFADEKCFSSIRTALFSRGKEQEQAIESILEALKTLDAELEGKKFFGGETIGFVDIVAGWIPHWLPVLEEVSDMKLLDAHRFPSLDAWAKNINEVPVIKENLPPRDKMMTAYHGKMKNMVSLATSK